MTRFLLIVVNMLLITAAVFFSVRLGYRLMLIDFDVPSRAQKDAQPIALQSYESIFPFSYYRHIVSRNLFHMKAAPLVKPEKKPVEKLASTDLNIRLWGTITGKEEAYAVIESIQPKQRYARQQLFKEGDMVSGAEIEKVYRDKVVLNLKGEKQLLQMEKYRSGKGPGRMRPQSGRPIRLTRALGEKEIEKAFQDINAVMGQARIRPSSDGLSISNIKRGSIFQRLGLRNGDTITKVNGRRIRSVEDALNFYSSLKSGSNAKLELSRRRRPYIITYRIR